jgi:hypothetical protein
MAWQLDFTKDPDQVLLDQINHDNASALTLALISFGIPTAMTGTNPNPDTQITVSSQAGSGYTGSVVVNYNRVDLSTIPGARSTVYALGNAANISDMIPEVNAAYQINLTAADYTDGPLPTFTGGIPNEEHNFQIAATADSVVYEGVMTLTLRSNDIPLSSVITSPTLTGLVYVQPS